MLSITTAMATSYDHALVILKVEAVPETVKERTEKVRELAAKMAEMMNNDGPIVLSGHDAFPHYDWQVSQYDNAYHTRMNGGTFISTALDDYIQNMGDATIYAGRGDDYIFNAGNSIIHAGSGDDQILTMSEAVIYAGTGDDRIDATAMVSVDAGDGNDIVRLVEGGAIILGDGNDYLDARGATSASGGNGDDWMGVGIGSIAYGDAGNDRIGAGSGSIAYGGTGNDEIVAGRGSTVDGGTGNDWLVVQGDAIMDGGEGNDLLLSWGGSILNGGAGDDLLVATTTDEDTAEGSILDGGDGNDFIQAAGLSTVTGGKENDTIHITGSGTTILYSKGDGSDLIRSGNDVTVAIDGFSAKDANLKADGDRLIVSFNGSQETLTFDLASGKTARLTFADGTTLNVTGAAFAKSFTEIDADSPAIFIGENAFYTRATSYAADGTSKTNTRNWYDQPQKAISEYISTSEDNLPSHLKLIS